jgi:hypothetical protein
VYDVFEQLLAAGVLEEFSDRDAKRELGGHSFLRVRSSCQRKSKR